jgi:signal transduction histidine kinase
MLRAMSALRWPLRGRVADVAIAVVVTVVVLGGTLLGVHDPGRIGHLDLTGLLLILLACGVLVLRRRFPVLVTIASLAACTVYYIESVVDGPVVLSFVVALYTVATERQLIVAAAIGALAMLTVVYGEVRSPVRHLDNLTLFMLAGWLVATVAIGAVTVHRRAYLQEAERRARDAERGKEEAAMQRAIEERLRIARELHDVLGHNISLINVQASAALHRNDPAMAHQALVAIKKTSKEALRELRTTLGVLRQVDEQAPTAPAPSLRGLGELVERAAAAGLEVRTEVTGAERSMPPEVDLAAYRIVQEALTNITRHAGASTAIIRIRYSEDDVSVQVDDDGAGGSPGDGNGIRGMGERARALGGTLAAGGLPSGGFRVDARLPIGDRS